MTTFTQDKLLHQNRTAVGAGDLLRVQSGTAAVLLQVTGTLDGAVLNVEASPDGGTSWYSIRALKLDTGAVAAALGSLGLYAVAVAGMDCLRVNVPSVGLSSNFSVLAIQTEKDLVTLSGGGSSTVSGSVDVASTVGLKPADLNIDVNRILAVNVREMPIFAGGDDLNVAAATDRSNWLEVATCRQIAIMCPLVLPEVATLEVTNTYVKPDGAGGFVSANLSDPADDQHVWRELRDEDGAAVSLLPGTIRVVSQLGGIYAVRIKLDSAAAANRYFYVTHQD